MINVTRSVSVSVSVSVLVLLTSTLSAADIESVRVLDGEFNVVKELSSVDLGRFHQHWANKKVITPAGVITWHYKIDVVETNNQSSRWLYHPNGFVRSLSVKQSASVYHIAESEKFNALLGIVKRTPIEDKINN